MISPENFFDELTKNEISFFTGVPDSLLKDFCAYVSDNVSADKHVITANEGGAIALAAGYHFATGKAALVYMQNSGLGNSINPLLSLADAEVYSVPMLLLIGFRGEPGKKDEPQHRKQGRVTADLLKAMEIDFDFINSTTEKNYKDIIAKAVLNLKKGNCPVALIVSEGVFEKYSAKINSESDYSLKREDAIKIILDNLSSEDIIISTTGKASREVYEYREGKMQKHSGDFLTVGSMGHCSQIALGVAIKKKDRQVFVLDGDGSVIMHAGAMAVIADLAPENFKHIILNNGAHDSVGGQPTAGFKINFVKIAKGFGYKHTAIAETEEQIITELTKLKKCKGPAMLEIRLIKGARKELGRPVAKPVENKKSFMEFLSE